MTPGSRQAAFADLHAAGGFLRPNPRNVGSARRMAARGLRRSSSGAQSARVTDATIRAAVMGMPAAGHPVPRMQAASVTRCCCAVPAPGDGPGASPRTPGVFEPKRNTNDAGDER